MGGSLVLAGSAWRRTRVARVIVVVSVALLVAAMLIARTGLPSGATSDASPYTVPQVVDVNPDPNIVETTIVADELQIADIGDGRTAKGAMAYNGSIPGPEFHLTVGQRVIVHFENHLDNEDTAIHWHGIELPNKSDGTPLTQNMVPPGGSYLYDFVVTRPGVYWYHPHHQYSTNQVVRGLYGALIVDDPNEAPLQANGTLPSPADTHTLMLSDLTICKAPGTNDTANYDPSLPWVGGGPLPAQGAPHPNALCDTPFDKDGNPTNTPLPEGWIANVTPPNAAIVNEGQTVITNGMNVGARAGTPDAPGALAGNAHLLDVRPGQGVRLQLIAPTQIRYIRLRLTLSDGTFVPLVRVGGEGGLLDAAVLDGGVQSGFDFKYNSGEILLGPSERADVVAAFPANATGVATLWTEDFQRLGAGFTDIPTVPVAHFNMTGSPVNPPYTIAAGTPLRDATGDTIPLLTPSDVNGTVENPATFSPPKTGNGTNAITLGLFNVNNVTGVHSPPGDYASAPHQASARYVKIGDTVELQVTNTSGLHHTFHMHGFSFQPVTLTRANNPTFTFPPEYVDAVDVPPNVTLTYRFKVEDRPQADGVTPGGAAGRWVFHCHMFIHAHLGLIAELVVTGPGGNERPYVDMTPTLVQANEGDVASVSGKVLDPDNDPVTMSANVGQVVNNGDGTWTWTHDTSGDSGTQRVFITGTDPGGLTGQVPFDLDVAPSANHAPTITASPNPATVTVGETSVVDLTTGDSDGDPVTTSITSGPAFASIVGGDLQLSPGAGDVAGSPYTVTVQADDGTDTSSVNVTVNVEAANQPPTITASPNPATVTAGQTSVVDLTTGDPDGDPVTTSITSGPGFASLVGGDLQLSPGAGDVAGSPYTVTVQADDGTDTSSVNVTVNVVAAPPEGGVFGDFNGDGSADFAVFRPSNSRWYINGIAGSTQWGKSGDVAAPGDYNGDGTTDIAVFRPSNGHWYVNGIAGSTTWGKNGDVAVPGDYNGDGTTDFAVFRPSNSRWYIDGIAGSTQFGKSGDVAVPADYNGDGTTDIAVFRPSNGHWYVNGIAGSTTWGKNGDVAVPGDYNGDGTTDFAVFRPSNSRWYIDGIAGSTQFGKSGDVAVPADYNGDGTTDVAIWRSSNGQWFVNGIAGSTQWGQSGDVPALRLPGSA